MTINEATVRIKASDLLTAIWYSDGSGAVTEGVGIDTTPGTWRVASIRLDYNDREFVLLDLVRAES